MIRCPPGVRSSGVETSSRGRGMQDGDTASIIRGRIFRETFDEGLQDEVPCQGDIDGFSVPHVFRREAGRAGNGQPLSSGATRRRDT
jgi:hypothetical protein